MEVISGTLPNSEFWAGKRVLVTGHTGFKGTWLTNWLHDLGSIVMGISLPNMESNSSHHSYYVDEEFFCDVSDSRRCLAESSGCTNVT